VCKPFEKPSLLPQSLRAGFTPPPTLRWHNHPRLALCAIWLLVLCLWASRRGSVRVVSSYLCGVIVKKPIKPERSSTARFILKIEMPGLVFPSATHRTAATNVLPERNAQDCNHRRAARANRPGLQPQTSCPSETRRTATTDVRARLWGVGLFGD
jgi:hypothetical protein